MLKLLQIRKMFIQVVVAVQICILGTAEFLPQGGATFPQEKGDWTLSVPGVFKIFGYNLTSMVRSFYFKHFAERAVVLVPFSPRLTRLSQDTSPSAGAGGSGVQFLCNRVEVSPALPSGGGR